MKEKRGIEVDDFNEYVFGEADSCEVKETFEIFFNTIPDAVLITRLADGYIVDVNEGFIALNGYIREEIIGKSTIEINIWSNIETRHKVAREINKRGFVDNLEAVFQRKDGSQYVGMLFAKKIMLKGVPHIINVVRNITEQKKADEETRKWASIFRDVEWGIVAVNAEIPKYELMNEAFARMHGYAIEELMAKSNIDVVAPSLRDTLPEKIRLVNETGHQTYESLHIRKDGSIFPVLIDSNAIKNEFGKVLYRAVNVQDITDRKQSEEKIEFLSNHDQVTGLYNRRYFDNAMEKLNDEKYVPLTLIMADINGLKLTNDAFGHKAGDELLEKIADILKRECRAEDIAARIGGDEFVLLLPETDSRNADKMINRINRAIAKENIDNVILSLSMGFAVKESHEDKMDAVFKRAEDEMYKRKLSESISMRGQTINKILITLFEKSEKVMVHSKNVSDICVAIASKMNFDNEDIEQIRVAGLMHDIGKIGIDEKILNNPRRLDSEEWNEIERHSEIGFRILSSLNEYSEIAEFVLAHHESWNGRGYPRGLKGDEIPLQSRIISVADAFDAMTSDRLYRKDLSEEETINELTICSGTQFDPKISRIFIEDVLGKEWR